MVTDNNDKIISYFGEFIDKNLERKYFDYEISHAIKFIKPVILALGVLYFLFIIPDWFLIKNTTTFKSILFNRIALIILIFIFYFRLRYLKEYWKFSYWVTIYEIIFVFSFFYIFYQYEEPNFLIQTFGIITILFAIFLVPNRWINMVAVSLVISTGFFIISSFVFESISTSEFSAAVVYTFLAIILNGIASWKTNYYKRIQYVNSKKLKELSITDSLTKIFNRLKFEEELQKWIELSHRYNNDLSIIMFDIDDFKKINDNLGHIMGDKVLIVLTQLVKKLLRDTDIFARWGGEEFVILLPNTSKENAFKVAKKIKFVIENFSFKTGGIITCSFGVTSFCDEEDIDSLIYRVDQLLYKAKQMGKNTIQM